MSIETLPATASGPAVHRVREGYWRVSAASGIVLGYVEEVADPRGARFRARKLYSSGRVAEVGEFWHPAEAVECLR